jgi:hypothetical protein
MIICLLSHLCKSTVYSSISSNQDQRIDEISSASRWKLPTLVEKEKGMVGIIQPYYF